MYFFSAQPRGVSRAHTDFKAKIDGPDRVVRVGLACYPQEKTTELTLRRST